MLATFENIWAARQYLSPYPGPSTAPLLVAPPVPPLAAQAPVPLTAVPVAGANCNSVFCHFLLVWPRLLTPGSG